MRRPTATATATARRAAVVVVAVVVMVAAAAAGCAARAPEAGDDGLCATVLRVPGDEVLVMTIGDDGQPVAVDASCDRVACLREGGDAVAVVQPDGTVWAAWPGRAGAVLAGEVEAAASVVERWARAQATAVPGGQPAAGAGRADAAPTLPATLRTCGTTTAGGGFGWHVILNDGDVWQRVHWSTAPSSQEVRALGKDAYPIATSTGALCAYALQTKPRTWRVHLAQSGQVVEAAPNNEHPPARCRTEADVEVRRADGLFLYEQRKAEVQGARGAQIDPARVAYDVVVTKISAHPAVARADADVHLDAVTSVARPTGALRMHLRDGTVRELPLSTVRDLAGRALPAGAVRERVLAAGDGKASLLVVERVRAPDCTTTESLHLIRADTGAVTPLSSGDVVYAKPVFAAERFWWVEARPRVMDLAGDVGVKPAAY